VAGRIGLLELLRESEENQPPALLHLGPAPLDVSKSSSRFTPPVRFFFD